MKIIEGMKKLKDLLRKAADLRQKISTYCADMSTDTPTYKTEADQRDMVAGWLQAHQDIIKEIERLRVALTHTNVVTKVPIEMSDGKNVSKTIQGWIMRRRELSKLDCEAFALLTNRGLKDQAYRADAKTEGIQISNVRRYYDQKVRDEKVAVFMAEPSLIDAALEVFNATAELVFPEDK
jgi:hypothetical protein